MIKEDYFEPERKNTLFYQESTKNSNSSQSSDRNKEGMPFTPLVNPGSSQKSNFFVSSLGGGGTFDSQDT